LKRGFASFHYPKQKETDTKHEVLLSTKCYEAHSAMKHNPLDIGVSPLYTF